ncbi:MAG: hypothetical protein LH614_03145 [Pyrinomonadaceae bacterium]|nr:hypothetical protein [Pyrinomonadaceae bacterium]
MKIKLLNLSLLTIFVLSIFTAVSDVNAQKSRRKKTVKPRPVVSTIRQPEKIAPTDISRQTEYLDGNQIVLGETSLSETTSEAVAPPTDAPTVEVTGSEARIRELTERIRSLESNKRNDYDTKQKRLLLNLDILSRAESRAESLRKQLFEMIEKEASVRTRLEQISFDARPETIERSTAFVGGLRPEELRDQRKKSLEAEKRNLESLLTQIQNSRSSLEENVSKADFLVEKVRLKLDKEIDDALADDKSNP